jgi:hypothetical protein
VLKWSFFKDLRRPWDRSVVVQIDARWKSDNTFYLSCVLVPQSSLCFDIIPGITRNRSFIYIFIFCKLRKVRILKSSMIRLTEKTVCTIKELKRENQIIKGARETVLFLPLNQLLLWPFKESILSRNSSNQPVLAVSRKYCKLNNPGRHAKYLSAWSWWRLYRAISCRNRTISPWFSDAHIKFTLTNFYYIYHKYSIIKYEGVSSPFATKK